MPPQNPTYCRIRAEKCERLTASATSADDRMVLNYLAHRWRELAAQDETPDQPALPSS